MSRSVGVKKKEGKCYVNKRLLNDDDDWGMNS
jgi:hypothetical protein